MAWYKIIAHVYAPETNVRSNVQVLSINGATTPSPQMNDEAPSHKDTLRLITGYV